jgi:hypothetical protein
MDLLKKHYEKIILGTVLLILMIGAIMLPVIINSEKRTIQEKADEIINRPARALEALDVSTNEVHLKQLRAGYKLDLGNVNRVFNPALWQEAADGHLIKVTTGREIGIEAVSVTKLTPLHLIISFKGIREAGSNNLSYVVGVERQAAATVSLRREKVSYLAAGGKNDVFILREVRGTPGETAELVLELLDTQERVTVSKEKPFRREDGFMVDLKYVPENRTWTDQRLDSKIKVGLETYKVVAIQRTEIVFSAESNQKKSRVPIGVLP